MELPALVSAAIQRVAESGSDGEIVRPVHYTSSLLRDFVVKTQMLGSNMTKSPTTSTQTAETSNSVNAAQETAPAKKKRGRPRKNDNPTPAPVIDTGTSKTVFFFSTERNGIRKFHRCRTRYSWNSRKPVSGVRVDLPLKLLFLITH